MQVMEMEGLPLKPFALPAGDAVAQVGKKLRHQNSCKTCSLQGNNKIAASKVFLSKQFAQLLTRLGGKKTP
jgi:hypothetical protein